MSCGFPKIHLSESLLINKGPSCSHECHEYCHNIHLSKQLRCFSVSAELPTFDISTKRAKLTEGEAPQAGEEKEQVEEERSSAAVEEWPEPPVRLPPPVHTAALLPAGAACPDGCQRFSSSEDPDPATVGKLR